LYEEIHTRSTIQLYEETHTRSTIQLYEETHNPTMSEEPTVLITHTVSPDRIESLRPKLEAALPPSVLRNATTPAETRELLPEAEMLVVGRFEEEWFEHADGLEVVQALSAGVDFLPVDRIESEGVALTNASGVHAEPIGEQVLAHMLQFERGLVETARNQRRGVWERVEGGELLGKTVGIVGVGAIGTRVAELAQAFGMEVIGTKRSLDDAPDAVDELFPAEEYHRLLGCADYVVVACPLTDETEGLLGIDEFRVMDEDAVLVNVARGAIVDQEALVRALQYRLVRGAALDVFAEEPLPPESVLWDLSNVVVTPHMAGSTPHKDDRWLEIITDNYEALASGDLDGLRNRVR
jgi:phosphoglycerate dehydrogenase-like enzyme